MSCWRRTSPAPRAAPGWRWQRSPSTTAWRSWTASRPSRRSREPRPSLIEWRWSSSRPSRRSSSPTTRRKRSSSPTKLGSFRRAARRRSGRWSRSITIRRPFVAEFVGAADFLPGVVTAEAVVTEIGVFANANGRPAGARVSVMIRPDDVTFVPDPAGDAVIVGRYFRGSENLYCLGLPSGQRVHSSQLSSVAYPNGLRVRPRPTSCTSSRFSRDGVAHPHVRFDIAPSVARAIDCDRHQRPGYDVPAALRERHRRPLLPLRHRTDHDHRARRHPKQLRAQPPVNAEPRIEGRAVLPLPSRITTHRRRGVPVLEGRPHRRDQDVEPVTGRDDPHRANDPRAETVALPTRRHRGQQRGQGVGRATPRPTTYTALEGAVDA